MKDAKGHGSDARGSNETSASRTNARQNKIWDTAKRLNPEKFGDAGAHSQGVQQVGQPPSADLKALNKTYDRNENNNFHSENIALLAKNFGTPAEHAQAKEIIAARNKQGYLTGSTKSVPNVHDWQYSIHQKYIGKLTGNRS